MIDRIAGASNYGPKVADIVRRRERYAETSRPMNSADIEYLWRTSDMFDQSLAIFMMVANLAIDDRIPPRGLKDAD